MTSHDQSKMELTNTSKKDEAIHTPRKKVVGKSGKPLHYNGSTFHRIIPYIMIQGITASIAETLVQIKYISELVSDLPNVPTFWACDCNVRGTPPISSVPLPAFGVLDGDGLCSSSVK
ncbi:peptidyl-prolyl cis-trans isomerase [Quercus suber]|uniref:Peptidyl-prolyl cis-trans isomerase n=1 Tax=Quercus suber TaxID=58331 RepID=A0AAW0KP88_QUESU